MFRGNETTIFTNGQGAAKSSQNNFKMQPQIVRIPDAGLPETHTKTYRKQYRKGVKNASQRRWFLLNFELWAYFCLLFRTLGCHMAQETHKLHKKLKKNNKKVLSELKLGLLNDDLLETLKKVAEETSKAFE